MLDHRHLLFAAVLLTAPVCACAPSQEGTDQCKDSNIDLLALTDAKFVDLPEAQGGLSPALRDAIDGAVNDFRSAHDTPIAGCALAVTRNDHIAYLQGYGLADVDANRGFTIATPAPVGSIAKTLTALGLLVFVEQNGLNLDLPVLDQMGIGAAWTENPTLRQVLAHKGGFIYGPPDWDATAFDDGPTMAAAFPAYDFPSLQPYLVFHGYKTMATNQTLPVGLLPAYSNVGYTLLGALLDYRTRAADVPAYMQGYEPFIWHKVARGSQPFGPAMTSACLATDFRTTDIKNLARGYTENGSPKSIGDSASTGWGWEGPSGGWSMTIGDLGRLMLILQSSAVITKNTIDTVMRENNGPLSAETDTGLGLELDPSGIWFGKGGDILGYTADMKIWPSLSGDSWGVAFMCNQRFAGKALTGDVHDVLDAGPSGFGGAGRGAGPRPQSAPDPTTIALATRYAPVVRAYAERYLTHGATPDQAWARARQDLARLPNGSRLVEAVERGDFVAALRLLPTIPQANPAASAR